MQKMNKVFDFFKVPNLILKNRWDLRWFGAPKFQQKKTQTLSKNAYVKTQFSALFGFWHTLPSQILRFTQVQMSDMVPSIRIESTFNCWLKQHFNNRRNMFVALKEK